FVLQTRSRNLSPLKKGKAANEDKMRETKRKRVPVRSLKEEEEGLLLPDSDDYDGDSLSGALHSDDFGSDIFDPEDDGSTEDGERESSEDEVDGLEGSDDNDDGDESELVDGSDQCSEQQDEESDSSEDEVAPRNTVGDIPLDWYKDEKHIGYDITGKKIIKKENPDKLESFLATSDDYKNLYKIYDEYNDEIVELTKKVRMLIHRMLKRKAPHADFDPHAPYVDWFICDDARHPLSSAPEPKRRFLPSKSEAKMVAKLVRAIRKGLIKFDKPEEELNLYLLWAGDSTSDQKTKQLTYIPPPKRKLPEEEKASYKLMPEEDRPKLIPQRFTTLRSIPAYVNALKESFDRCLDLYLCPRVRKKRINIDPESLKPKLPSRNDLRPFPDSCYLEYKGHTAKVTTISTDCYGQWIASGSTDGSVRIWEVETGRCLKIWQFDEAIKCVAWNPLSGLSILAVAMGRDLVILNTELDTDEEQEYIKELLHLGNVIESKASVAAIARWLPDEKYGGIMIRHFKNVSSIDWHRKGDYLSTVMASGETPGVVIHQISKKLTQKPFKIRGLPVTALFHPSRSYLFIATRKNVRVYNLLKVDEPIKKLETGMREISSLAIHPGGDNLIVGSKEGKMCWFDMDLSSKPYKTLKNHPKDITNVVFHRSYPLFASSSEDSTAYVFHGKVYNDLNENPLIVPLEILRGHSTSSNGGGVLDCKFHPRQPWLFTAGADSNIKLYCH
ncbi:WD40-repeat-containing domain, partial [Arabidopsis thaliana x Arabidopsis arenosa]